MRRDDIKECADIDTLKKLCLAQYSELFTIGEILVDESKWHITSEEAVRKIREVMGNERRN